MKATGIVRRIDDLGRIVIPKEIRRVLRIREGDPLEIFTEKEIYGADLEKDQKAVETARGVVDENAVKAAKTAVEAATKNPTAETVKAAEDALNALTEAQQKLQDSLTAIEREEKRIMKQYNDRQTKIEKMEDSHGGSYDIVCSKCSRHQPIGFMKTYFYIKLN